jgi:hypothetical protein
MTQEYVNVPLPGQEGPEQPSCAECQRALPTIPYRSLNRPQRYCSASCCRRGHLRAKRWRALQGIPEPY